MSAVARRYQARGLSALERDDLETAAEALRAAVDLAPSSTSARCAYAVALAKLGDCPRAAQSLRAGLGRSSTAVARAAMWATLGDVLTLGGDFLGAEEAFNQAAVEPSFEARAAAGLARVYGKLGRFPAAVKQLARAAELTRG